MKVLQAEKIIFNYAVQPFKKYIEESDDLLFFHIILEFLFKNIYNNIVFGM